jgi:tetratricopeptide (TPR) repeat protein
LERVQELLKLIPNNLADQDARFWRARAWCEDTLGNLEQAESSLRHAYKLDPYWWQIHFQLHDLLRRRGKLEESAKFLEIYKASKELSTTIMSLNQSVESLDEQKFCRSLLELSELVGDDEVSHVLRDRLAPD